MKSTPQKATRATARRSQPTPVAACVPAGAPIDAQAGLADGTRWVSLAPRATDGPDIERDDIKVTVSMTTTLSDTLSSSSTGRGDTRWLTWTGTVVREMDALSDDPEDGVAVLLQARLSTSEKWDDKPRVFEEETVNLGRLSMLPVSEFRRMLAALNALAAALPSTPEVALRTAPARGQASV
jgi:hypothetical protein